MKVKTQALPLYMLCLLISIEIHQINCESKNWTPLPPLRPFEDEDENSTPGSMSEVPNNKNVAAPTQFSVPETLKYRVSSTPNNKKISTPAKSVMMKSKKPGDRSNNIQITTQPITNQVLGDDTSARESYTTELEMDGKIFGEKGSGGFPTADDSNEITSTIAGIEDNITTTAHDLSTSEVVLLIGVSLASLLLVLSAFIILAITLVVVVRNKQRMVINMITVHDHGTSGNIENDSDDEGIDEQSEQILLVQETTNKEISHAVVSNSRESNLVQSRVVNTLQVTVHKELEREDENIKIDLEEVMTTAENETNVTEHELVTDTVAGSEPRIINYESVVTVDEGEQVVLSVNFTGIPTPTITWTFKGTKMEGDYATELGTDGSLLFFCVESKHAGRYNFIIKNDLGSAQGSITLIVKDENSTEQCSEATDVVNKTNSPESNPITVEEYEEYVAGLHSLNNKGFETQYKALPSGEEGKQVSVGKSGDYRCLNRFKNVTAYDDCRVVLEPIMGHPDYQHDYINASYVEGFTQAKMFIAAQGPLPHTVIDFWRLVWQEKVETIAMVTNLREGMRVKCEQYWPERGNTMRLGPYMVTTMEQHSFPYYIARKILLEYTAGIVRVGIAVSREIVQYHYTSWPDHGVPECPGPILDYLRRVKSGFKSGDRSILVHCSAGVGRTGTLIAIDIALSQASKEKQVDIPKIIMDMRRQRMKMVQNVDQYAFIHDAVLEALICGDTRIPASDLRQVIENLTQTDEENERKTGFEQQFEILEQVSTQPQEIASRAALMHSDKNRNNNFLPPDKWRVRLRGRNPDQDYIHASYTHSYKQRKGFIIAQSPVTNTVVDFVKMLYERECGVVVMLCGCEEGGVELCAQYWPATATTMQHGELLVSTVEVTERDGITQRLITITNSRSESGEAEHEVTLFQVDQWNAEDLCSNRRALIDMLNQVWEIQRNTGNKPIIVHGNDTVSRVGVFCSLVNAIEMCKTEGVVDVFQVVKALRIQKPGAVSTTSQYSSIFGLVLIFLQSDIN